MGNQISFPYEQQTTNYSAHSICRMSIECQVQFSSMRGKWNNSKSVMQHTSEILLKKVGGCIFQSAAHSQMDIAKYIPGFTITK
jgi:hypothetical protein